MRCRRFLPALLLLGLTGGCTASPPLPAGGELVSAAETTFAQVQRVHFAVEVNGVLPGFTLRQAEGDATLTGGGHASGQAQVQNGAQDHKFDFELDGDTATTKDASGASSTRRSPLTVAGFLGEHGGLAQLLGAVTGARTEIQESVHGVDAYRVGGSVPAAVAARLLPQIHDDVLVKIWVTTSEPRRFARLWLQVPPETQRDNPVMFEVTLSQQDQAADPAQRAADAEPARK
ncbi:LppX_LprAFG lipoprotein [Amycolatopsis sp. PS_44_ISF1]|uniref:LppX_LprAFG lipoprotein n=1 Tax=Amycolatopsis sp. PS_44_ISF1 TaxID=2974917 RepID=UPI0028DE80B5|nr:LppX_LprAFG lipoprotein [Amycolatopsis sp. PS_44_ISF1]MDT8909304.1 LppX_LprAFG lipoprotein [Amycolatopsis sp. PS_44_ISF1]